MSAPEYLQVQSELTAVHSRLNSVAQSLDLRDEAKARSSILLAMDSILLAEDLLRELQLASPDGGSSRRSVRHRFDASFLHPQQN